MEVIEFAKELPFLTDVPIVLIIVWLILTGRLVPKRTVDALLSGRDAQIEDWKSAYETRGELAQETLSQSSRMLEANTVTQHVLEEILARAERGPATE